MTAVSVRYIVDNVDTAIEEATRPTVGRTALNMLVGPAMFLRFVAPTTQ